MRLVFPRKGLTKSTSSKKKSNHLNDDARQGTIYEDEKSQRGRTGHEGGDSNDDRVSAWTLQNFVGLHEDYKWRYTKK